MHEDVMKICNFMNFIQTNQKMNTENNQNKEMITEIIFENANLYLKDSHISYDLKLGFSLIIQELKGKLMIQEYLKDKNDNQNISSVRNIDIYDFNIEKKQKDWKDDQVRYKKNI